MIIEQPAKFLRWLYPHALWRMDSGERAVYLTFDDGPIPEVTPWVLDVLDRYGIKATFFMVGDNVRRHPELLEEVKRRGHSFGNHTYHHLQGMKTTAQRYIQDISQARELIDSPLFRPPHGLMRWKQAKILKEHFNIVMYDLVTRDYSKRLSPEHVVANVMRYARNGSIIVFHDSDKGSKNLRKALPEAIEWLLAEGYCFKPISME